MTAVAKLPEDDDGMPIGYADWYNNRFFGQPVNTARDHDCETAWRAGALHARAALSPAELGGVVSALAVFRIAGGDTECCPNPSAEMALGCLNDLRECYDEALSTPRAAEVVTDEMVDSVRADIMQAAANDGRLHIVLKDEWVRAALTAALTPPSAKGE